MTKAKGIGRKPRTPYSPEVRERAVGFNSTVMVGSQASAVRASAIRLQAGAAHDFEPDTRAQRGSRVLPSGRARRVHVKARVR